ncbi:VCBS repeat-containing protein, partial [Candidatus Bathyarchaeota archaeon]|nr:VCBS repeat-containing protein [Candidatus Bathyarchaeota archaeon]
MESLRVNGRIRISLVLILIGLVLAPTLVLAQPVDAAPTFGLKWSKTGTPGGGMGIVIGDINNDGIMEIIKSGTGRTMAIRGTNGETVWSVSTAGAIDTTQPQMADMDKDGYLEIIVPILGPPAGFYILDGKNGAVEQKTTINGRCDNGPVIGDVDGSGYPTLFFACMTFVETTEDS